MNVTGHQDVIFLAVILFTLFASVKFSICTPPGDPTEQDEEAPCRISFNNDRLNANRTTAVVQQCIDKYPMRYSNDNATEDEKIRAASENESNCALKCINDNLNVTTANGLVDVSKILEHFRYSNATTAYVDNLSSLLSACEKDTEQKVQLANDENSDRYLCKYHVMFMRCYRDSYLASRSEINKACKE